MRKGYRSVFKRCLLPALVLTILAVSSPSLAHEAHESPTKATADLDATIVEYPTPTAESAPADLAFDRQGMLWFTMIQANKIGRLDPAKAQPGESTGITEFPVPTDESNPYYVAIGPKGRAWFTERTANNLGMLDPDTGEIQEYSIPTPRSEPHALTFDDQGRLWFTEFGANQIARFDPATEVFHEIPIPEAGGHPHDIAVDSQGHVWFTLGGLFFAGQPANRIGRYDPSTGLIDEFTIPPDDSVPHGLALGSNDSLWVTLFFANALARVAPGHDGEPDITTYPAPTEKSRPHDLVFDETGRRVWFVTIHGNTVGRLDLSNAEAGTAQAIEEFRLTCDPCHPSSITLGPDGDVWFTEMGMFFRGAFGHQIGRLRLTP